MAPLGHGLNLGPGLSLTLNPGLGGCGGLSWAPIPNLHGHAGGLGLGPTVELGHTLGTETDENDTTNKHNQLLQRYPSKFSG